MPHRASASPARQARMGMPARRHGRRRRCQLLFDRNRNRQTAARMGLSGISAARQILRRDRAVPRASVRRQNVPSLACSAFGRRPVAQERPRPRKISVAFAGPSAGVGIGSAGADRARRKKPSSWAPIHDDVQDLQQALARYGYGIPIQRQIRRTPWEVVAAVQSISAPPGSTESPITRR